MVDLYIEKVNATHIRLYSEDDGILLDVYENYQYDEPGFQKNKYTKWNGRVRLFNKSNLKLPVGLLQDLVSLSIKRGWSVELDDRLKNAVTKVTPEEIHDWVSTIPLRDNGNELVPYDYQYDAVYQAVKHNRLTLLAATSAGKSLIIYLLVRFYQMIAGDDEKILIIVPSTNLVSQMIGDFTNYSSDDKEWDCELNTHYIWEGRPKNARRKVYVSTYQSIMDEAPDYFEQFGYIICDEVHGASGKSIQNIMNNSINAYRRVGLTGTLKSDKVHEMLVKASFGPVYRVVTAKQLIDSGRASKTDITMMYLKYNNYERNLVSQMSYQQEIEFIISHAYRNKVLVALAKGLKGNTLIMFDRKDKHLHKVRSLLSESGKNVFVIDGDVPNEERDVIKKLIENGDDVVLLATYGCMSTGVSVKKLHNLVLAHPTKSIVRVLQTIGRLLRLHSSKDVAAIFDIVDECTIEGKINSCMKHALDRFGYYRDEQHPVKSRSYEMKTHEETI